MKKLLFVLAIGAFVACNDNAGTNEDATVDTTTTAPVITPDTAVAPLDTTGVANPTDTSASN